MATTWSIARRAGACAVTERPFEDGERHISLLRVREGALERVDICMSAWRDERRRMEAEGSQLVLPQLGGPEPAGPEPAESGPAGSESVDPESASPGPEGSEPGGSEPEGSESGGPAPKGAVTGAPKSRSGANEPLLYWTTHHEVTKKKTVQIDLESLERLFVQLEGRDELAVRELRYVLCLLLMRKRRVKVERVLRKDGEESFLVKRPRVDERYTVYVYDFEPEQLEALRAQLQAVFDGAEGPHGVRLGLDEDSDDPSGGSAEDSSFGADGPLAEIGEVPISDADGVPVAASGKAEEPSPEDGD